MVNTNSILVIFSNALLINAYHIHPGTSRNRAVRQVTSSQQGGKQGTQQTMGQSLSGTITSILGTSGKASMQKSLTPMGHTGSGLLSS
eukprot:Pgem_evm1s1266